MQVKVYHRLADMPRGAWDGLVAGHSCTQSSAMWQVVESSGLNDFAYRYALFSDEAGVAIIAASFYTITTDIAIFAQGWLRSALIAIRRVFPNFLKVRMLECGTPITLTSPPMVWGATITAAAAVAAVHDLLIATARAEGHFMVVVRDFEPSAGDVAALFQQHDYVIVDNLPNTYMDVAWPDSAGYLASLKSYYRSKVVKHLKRNQELGVRHELVTDFAGLADTLCAQWAVVHGHAHEFQREVLTPTFYREFSDRLGEQSKVLLLYRGDALVGHALLLCDGDLLRWLYFGRSEAGNDSLYLYVGQKIIETAMILGMKRIELGLTTYPIKQDLGAIVTPLKMALRAPSWFINPLVKWVYPLLNDTPNITNREVFKRGSGPQ